MKKLKIGAHISTSGGLYKALHRGKEIGCTAIQIFTSNQKQWKGRVMTDEILDDWKKAQKETHLTEVMCHDSYLINLGSDNPELLEKSRTAFKNEIKRCLDLKIRYLNFHPGTATSGDEKQCLDTIVKSLNTQADLLKDSNLILLLETTAGQGRSIGHQFEHLAYILKYTDPKIPLGVCIDTCHIFAAGYDIRTPSSFDETFKKFDEIIGLKNLYAFHLNDSKKEFASRRDRHAPLGKGEIGLKAFEFLVTDSRTRNLPMFLETPEPEIWKDELNLLREFAGETHYDGQDDKTKDKAFI